MLLVPVVEKAGRISLAPGPEGTRSFGSGREALGKEDRTGGGPGDPCGSAENGDEMGGVLFGSLNQKEKGLAWLV